MMGCCCLALSQVHVKARNIFNCCHSSAWIHLNKFYELNAFKYSKFTIALAELD
jgi:hypothetical protein